MLLPRNKHDDPESIRAKEVELQKLRDFSTYEDVDDLGQCVISTTWVLWRKGSETRARLVARGFEEDSDI